jgi:hypothetical protein
MKKVSRSIMLNDITTPIYPKLDAVLSLSIVIMMLLLLPNLCEVYASNNLDNTSQKKLEFGSATDLTNNNLDSVYGQFSASNDHIYGVPFIRCR